MKIQFIGTGAADWDWSLPLAPGVRGSTASLLDGHILIDAGPTVVYEMEQQGISPSDITDVLITHSHSDHFNAENMQAIASAPRTEALRIFASSQALERLEGNLEKVPLIFGKEYLIGNLRIMALPANHSLQDITENAYHFLVVTQENKRLLYALDGGWLTSAACRLLHGEHLDMIIWDATSGNCFNDWRFADHNELRMIQNMRSAMASLELVNEKTIHVFNHIACTLWPEKPEERARLADEYEGILAEDGMQVIL